MMMICQGVPILSAFKSMQKWCIGCEAGYPHQDGDIPDYIAVDCHYFKLRPMDQEMASNVLTLPGSKSYNQKWGTTDDPEPWDEEI
jgi:hypothetical protein